MMRSPTKLSPDSVPSLSATTTSSTFTDQVVRELFPIPREAMSGNKLYASGDSLHAEVDRESLFGSDISVASEGTYVSSSDDDRMIHPEQNDNRDDDSPEDGSQVKMFPGCHGAISLPPNFPSTMFNIFDSSHKKGAYDDAKSAANSVNDAATEVASNIDHSILLWERKIDSLEREIATLKGIIKSDSVTILNLKTALSEYQEKECLPSDGFISEQGSELSVQQFKEYEETIQQLHDEIEVLTKKEGDDDKLNIEAQLQLQNEIFASQIIESESEIRKSQDIISQIAEDNVKLSMELSVLRAQPLRELECVDDKTILPDSIVLQADMVRMKNWMADIEKKLESGFYCKCTQHNQFPCNDAIEENTLYPRNCEPLLDTEVDEEIDEVETKDEVNCSDVEVTIEGMIITNTGTEATTQAPEDHNLPQKTISHAPFTPTLGVAETDCNFCGCLRTTSRVKETDQ